MPLLFPDQGLEALIVLVGSGCHREFLRVFTDARIKEEPSCLIGVICRTRFCPGIAAHHKNHCHENDGDGHHLNGSSSFSLQTTDILSFPFSAPESHCPYHILAVSPHMYPGNRARPLELQISW